MHESIPEVNTIREPAGPYKDLRAAEEYTSIPAKTLRKYVRDLGVPAHQPAGPNGKLFFSIATLDALMAGQFGVSEAGTGAGG